MFSPGGTMDRVSQGVSQLLAQPQTPQTVVAQQSQQSQQQSSPQQTSQFQSIEDETLIAQWRTEPNNSIRDLILNEMSQRGLYPEEDVRRDEADGALYPDISDDNFINLLMKKREFVELRSEPFKVLEEGEEDPCSSEASFRITPVQQFIRNFLSPKTPYNSALLYHSVGVGKTQAGIQVAEGFLEVYPRKKIFIIAPKNIQSGFYRNIFDINRIAIGTGNEPNIANQGTGDLYMRLTGTIYERDKAVIERKVNETIRRRYAFYGYLAFRNYIRKVIDKRVGRIADPKIRVKLMDEALRNEFSGRVLIVDEAHHLRDEEAAMEDNEELDTAGAGGKEDVDDTNSGSKLAPYLKQVLVAVDGLKLVLMTATPMYNTAKEIVTLLNFMLLNDKKQTLTEGQLFDKKGSLRPGSQRLLHRAASAYISFMRGENPRTFPVRLFPRSVGGGTEEPFVYPGLDPGGIVKVREEDKVAMRTLPLVPSYLEGDGLAIMERLMEEEIPDSAAQSGRYSIRIRDRLIQAGNFIFPGEEGDDNIGDTGFQNTFVKEGLGIATKYRAGDGISADWLAVENIGYFSPKAATVLRSIQSAKGVCFVYSRFVTTGVLVLALALEANGYTLASRTQNLFADGIQSPGGRQCALCPLKERGHGGGGGGGSAAHAFTPAKYVLLTGNDEISPRNAESIAMARASENAYGRQVKVVLGSQVAAEGVDLRFVREIHIFDSWYHLNKTDQVIGRGIRFCSHSLLPQEQRNATIFLHVLAGLEGRETMDLYSYRQALFKAKQVGEVSRQLKIHALDCNLNRDAIQILGQPPIRMEDSQGVMRDNVNINDTPFSPLCDWLETCEYKCVPEVNTDIQSLDALDALDDSTYDEYSARYKESRLKTRVRNLFAMQAFYDVALFRQNFIDVPNAAYGMLLADILGNKSFHVKHKMWDGYIIYRNKYFLFQPTILEDTNIPLALRTTYFTVRRDAFTPTSVEQRKLEDIPEAVEAQEEEDAEAAVTAPTTNKWQVLSAWAKSMIDVPVTTLTDDVDELLNQIAGRVAKKYRRYKQEFEVLLTLPSLFKGMSGASSGADILKRVVLEYIFDEWLTEKDQEAVLRSGADEGTGKENYVKVGSIELYRFVNLKAGGEIVYRRKDGEAIPRSLLDIIESSATDEVLKRRAYASVVGPFYGFITTKGGDTFVFKRGEPTKEGVKPNRGAECAIVSETADKIKKIGEMIELYGKEKIDANTFGSIKNTNSFQLCVIIDIFLRLMDAQRFRGKRWFFRPVAAAVSGHKGKA